MHYPIPSNPEEIIDLRQKPVSDELVATAIAGVIQFVRSQGQSLDQLTAQLLADDSILDDRQRRRLSEVVTQAWENFA